MSDTYTEDEQDIEQERTVTLKRDQIRSLEKQAKQASEAIARAEAAERKLGFAEAGISLSDPKMAYFVKGYDGDLSPDAIRQAATDAGFLAPPEKQSDDSEAIERMNRTEAGSTTQNVGPDAEYLAAMDAARTVEEVTAVAARFGRLIEPQ